MMDKGFVIADLLEKVPASYATPPFSQMNCQQFEENEVTETQNIARVRIHVRRIKENNLFDKVIQPNQYRNHQSVVDCFICSYKF